MKPTISPLQFLLARLFISAKTAVLLLFLVLAPSICGQFGFPKHNLSVGLGWDYPRTTLRSSFTARPELALSYGYRLHKFAMAGITADRLFSPSHDIINIYNNQYPDFRAANVVDKQNVVSIRGLGILPLRNDWLRIFAGGGPAYVRYRISQDGNIFLPGFCRGCYNRSGWGYHVILGTSIALDRSKHFRVGASSRFLRARTRPEPSVFFPPPLNHESLKVSADFSFNF